MEALKYGLAGAVGPLAARVVTEGLAVWGWRMKGRAVMADLRPAR